LKKVIASFVALAMALTMIPFTVYAASSIAVDSVSPATIVETFPSAVAVHISASADIDPASVNVYMNVAGVQTGLTKASAAGDAVISLDKAPAAGTYQIIASSGAVTASAPIQVLPYDKNIWKMTFGADDNGLLTAAFNADLQPDADYTASVGGTAVKVVARNGRVLTLDAAAAALAENAVVKIGGVRYPALYPRYSFTLVQEYTSVPSGYTPVYAPMVLNFDAPATDWMSQSMPLGNGYTGFMVFGGVDSDKIEVNEHALWSGGPGAVNNGTTTWNGGLARSQSAYFSNLTTARQHISDTITNWSLPANRTPDYPASITPGNTADTGFVGDSTLLNAVKGLMGNTSGFGSYQQISNININAPVQANAAVVQSSASDSGTNTSEQVGSLFDNNPNTKWYSGDAPAFPITINWAYDRAVTNAAYSFTTGNDSPGRDPAAWDIYGSNDGANYTLIDSRTGFVSSQTRYLQQVFTCGQFSYQYFRLVIKAVQSGAACQMADIAMDCDTTVRIVSSSITAGCEGNSSEQSSNMLDGKSNTKWYNSTNPTASNPITFSWQYSIPKAVTSLTTRTGGDMTQRDPNNWTLQGSNNGNNWTILYQDSGTNLTTTRWGTDTWPLTTTGSFKYFRFVITGVRTSGSGTQLSELRLNNTSDPVYAPPPSYTNYHRQLDLDNAVSTVTYSFHGVNYKKEYFVSYPDKVGVIRITADQPGSLTDTISMTTPQTAGTFTTVGNDTIRLAGYPSDVAANNRAGFANCLHYAEEVKVIPTGGTMSIVGGAVQVTGADAITILTSTGTNYNVNGCTYNPATGTSTFNYFFNVDPMIAVDATVAAAAAKPYAQLLASHQADYKNLYDRVKLDLGGMSVPNMTLKNLQLGYNSTDTAAQNRYYETLYYQFGRYLMIESSRPGSMPANLQGIWADGISPPWNADYHTNVNLQMNYWPVEENNLSECDQPLIDYITGMVPSGENTAHNTTCTTDGTQTPARGWACFHVNDIWGFTAPETYPTGFWAPTAGAWLAMNLWEHYEFTLDKTFLANNYDTLLKASLYLVDSLYKDPRDNTWVMNPSYSPEHGPYTLGCGFDQAVCWQIFTDTIAAANVLGKNGDSTIAEIQAKLDGLSGPKIGPVLGQFQEWKDDTLMDQTDAGYRHTNHLVYLFPGNYVVPGRSAQDNTYANAIKVALNIHGDQATGWSRAWKFNLWARLLDGDRAWSIYSGQISNTTKSGSTLENLWDIESGPYQIDGNLGASAGVAEMLLQSQAGTISLLPALPMNWRTGSVKGLKARGNVEVGVDWQNMVPTKVVLGVGTTQAVTVNGLNIASGTLWDGVSKVSFTSSDPNTIRFDGVAGRTYTLTGIQRPADTVKSLTVTGSSNVAVPGSGPASYQFNASVSYNLQGTVVDNSAVNWSLDGTYPGIGITPSGALTVDTTATNQAIRVIATAKSDPTKTASMAVNVSTSIIITMWKPDNYAGGSGGADGKSMTFNGKVEYTANNCWLMFKNIDLGKGISQIIFNYEAGAVVSGRYVQVLYTPAGVNDITQAVPIVQIPVPNMNGWGNLVQPPAQVDAGFAPVTGPVNLYFQVHSTGDCINMTTTTININR